MSPGDDKQGDLFLNEKIEALGEIDGHETYRFRPKPSTAQQRRASRKEGALSIQQRRKKEHNRQKNKLAKASRKANRG